jgi:long-chain fatty acid transport protein
LSAAEGLAPAGPRLLKEDNNMKTGTRRFLQKSAVAAAIAGLSAPASASFFALAEQNGSGMGTAFAGGAAIAEDASTVWYNPAGMTRLDRPQLVVAGSYIDLNIKTNVLSATTTDFSGVGGPPSVPIGGGAGKAPGEPGFVPSLYYTHPITKDFSVGGGINAPFGLTTEYDSTWAGRYHAVKSEITGINYNVSGAYKFSDVLSGGVGVDYQHFKAELTQAVDFATLCTVGGQSGTCGFGAGFNPTTNPNDGSAKVTADGNAWGYNLGLLWQLPDDFRIGVAYRSKIKQSLKGNFDPTVPTPAGVAGIATAGVANALHIVSSGATTDVTLPASISVSFYQGLGPQWAIMADVTRTNWSSIPELRIRFDSGQADSVVTLNLIDTYRFSVGTTYKPNDTWILRGGLAYDQSPVTNPQDTSPRLPDGDRTWAAVGAGFKASPNLNFDFGYAYIHVAAAQVRKTGTPTNENAARGNLSVDYTATIQVLSAQARWQF